TTILVTHDQAEALSMSDEVVLMQLGKIVDLGDPRGLYQSPVTLPTATFVGASNILGGTALHDARAGETVEVQLDGPHRIRATAQVDVTADARVDLAIKPEDIEVDASRSTGATGNELNCSIANLIYYGSHTLLTLRTPEGGEIELRAWGDKNSLVAVGDEVA